MKAVIMYDRYDTESLKLRIVSEGANDRTLMLLLERPFVLFVVAFLLLLAYFGLVLSD